MMTICKDPKVLNAWKEQFLSLAREKYGDTYDYSKVVFVNSGLRNLDKGVCIGCPKHGDFYQIPSEHIRYKKIPCPQCFSEYLKLHPPKGKYVRKRPLPPKPDEYVNSRPIWVRYCKGCGKKLIYTSWENRRKADKKNSYGGCCMRKKYFVGKGPWKKPCVDCGKDVTYTTVMGFVSKRKCRCKPCLNTWIKTHNSIQSTLLQGQIKKSGLKFKPYTFPDGRVEKVQGFEPYTIDYLLKTIPSVEIRTSYHEKPHFKYDFGGMIKMYLPDAYVTGTNTVVETKSTWTWKNDVQKNLHKIKAVLDAGYPMRVIIWGGGGGKGQKPYLVVDKSFSPPT